jgi:hypothetical protein
MNTKKEMIREYPGKYLKVSKDYRINLLGVELPGGGSTSDGYVFRFILGWG